MCSSTTPASNPCVSGQKCQSFRAGRGLCAHASQHASQLHRPAQHRSSSWTWRAWRLRRGSLVATSLSGSPSLCPGPTLAQRTMAGCWPVCLTPVSVAGVGCLDPERELRRTAVSWHAVAIVDGESTRLSPRLHLVPKPTESLTSRFVILDAHRIGAGPIAVASLPHPLPHGLHGSCSNTAYMPTHGTGSATLSSNAVPFTPPSAPLLGGETSLQGTG